MKRILLGRHSDTWRGKGYYVSLYVNSNLSITICVRPTKWHLYMYNTYYKFRMYLGPLEFEICR